VSCAANRSTSVARSNVPRSWITISSMNGLKRATSSVQATWTPRCRYADVSAWTSVVLPLACVPSTAMTAQSRSAMAAQTSRAKAGLPNQSNAPSS
jgi:hypothetical protein